MLYNVLVNNVAEDTTIEVAIESDIRNLPEATGRKLKEMLNAKTARISPDRKRFAFTLNEGDKPMILTLVGYNNRSGGEFHTF